MEGNAYLSFLFKSAIPAYMVNHGKFNQHKYAKLKASRLFDKRINCDDQR